MASATRRFARNCEQSSERPIHPGNRSLSDLCFWRPVRTTDRQVSPSHRPARRARVCPALAPAGRDAVMSVLTMPDPANRSVIRTDPFRTRGISLRAELARDRLPARSGDGRVAASCARPRSIAERRGAGGGPRAPRRRRVPRPRRRQGWAVPVIRPQAERARPLITSFRRERMADAPSTGGWSPRHGSGRLPSPQERGRAR